MFLGNTSIARCKDENKLNFCFLVPMELVFEDFVFNFIKSNFSKDYKEITKQKSNLFLADLYVDDNYLGRAFNLRQDIFLKDNEGKVKILDTKYKILNSTDYPKFGISQSDMYQMTSYAFRGGYKDLLLIYPKSKGIEGNLEYQIKNQFVDDNVSIKVNTVSFRIEYSKYLNNTCTNDLYKENDKIIYNELKIT